MKQINKSSSTKKEIDDVNVFGHIAQFPFVQNGAVKPPDIIH